MGSNVISLIGFLSAVGGILFLLKTDRLFSENPYTIAIQILAFALMVWARITFGIRSFHATANATRGGLITNGPYRLLRHPIYAAIIYFCTATLIPFPDIY